MTEHTIKIEGLPEGWEVLGAKVKSSRYGDYNPKETETGLATVELSLRRKVRKYDWSKTLDDVLVELAGRTGIFTLEMARVLGGTNSVSDLVWQPNIHGKCPVDGQACIVRVRYPDGNEGEAKAGEFIWTFGSRGSVVAYQFIRLAEGVEW